MGHMGHKCNGSHPLPTLTLSLNDLLTQGNNLDAWEDPGLLQIKKSPSGPSPDSLVKFVYNINK